jgi:hypothetical protein
MADFANSSQVGAIAQAARIRHLAPENRRFKSFESAFQASGALAL